MSRPSRLPFLLALSLVLAAPALAEPLPEKIRVATWNLEWFFDDDPSDDQSDLAKEMSAPSEADWDWRLQTTAAAIAKLDATILALQEIENAKVLRDLTKILKERHKLDYKIAFIEGGDVFTGQDVAILYRGALVEFRRREQTREMFESRNFYNIQKHLFARFEWGDGEGREAITIMTVHLRSGADDAEIRARQCRLIQRWLAPELTAGEKVIVLGDTNSSENGFPPPQGSDVDILSGASTEATDDDLVDLLERLPANERATHLNGDSYDRIFVSENLTMNGEGPDLVFSSIERRKDACVRGAPDRNHRDNYWRLPPRERDVSDHYPLVVEFATR